MMEVTFTQNTIEYILLILVRIASFMSVAPFFGQPNTPVRLKLGFSIFVSVLLFYTLPAQTVPCLPSSLPPSTSKIYFIFPSE